MANTLTNTVAKGLTSVANPSVSALWYETNFNMPVQNCITGFVGGPSPSQPVTYNSASSSFDLTGFSPGFEICVGAGYLLFDNTGGGTSVTVSGTLTISWTTTGGTILNGISYSFGVSTTVLAGNWYEYFAAANVGCQASEIASSTTYDFRSSYSGVPTVSAVTTPISFTNVPSTSTTSSVTGAIWVEGNNLCFINADQWKHTMVGNYVSSSPGVGAAGCMWVDTTTQLLHWVGGNGDDYSAPWALKQFASWFSNSSTGTTFAGTGLAGCIWMDSQFGDTHLGYIGSDGYKYLAGAGVAPVGAIT